MADAANVRSVSALADLRAALAKFASAVRQSLDEVDMELRRAVDWVRLDRPGHWKHEMQRAWDRVAEARNELAQCEARAYDGQRPSCYQEKKALEAAKAYVRICQEKIDLVRHWGVAIGQEASDYQGYVGQLRMLLDGEVPRSMALLERMIAAVESYVALRAPIAARPPAAGEAGTSRPTIAAPATTADAAAPAAADTQESTNVGDADPEDAQSATSASISSQSATM